MTLFSLCSGKQDGSVLGEASWNGPNHSWIGQLGALASVNSDHNHHAVSLVHCFLAGFALGFAFHFLVL